MLTEELKKRWGEWKENTAHYMRTAGMRRKRRKQETYKQLVRMARDILELSHSSGEYYPFRHKGWAGGFDRLEVRDPSGWATVQKFLMCYVRHGCGWEIYSTIWFARRTNLVLLMEDLAHEMVLWDHMAPEGSDRHIAKEPLTQEVTAKPVEEWPDNGKSVDWNNESNILGCLTWPGCQLEWIQCEKTGLEGRGCC